MRTLAAQHWRLAHCERPAPARMSSPTNFIMSWLPTSCSINRLRRGPIPTHLRRLPTDYTRTEQPLSQLPPFPPPRAAGRKGVRHLVSPKLAASSRSPPTGFRFWGIHRHCRHEAIPVRHFDLRQGLFVHDIGLLDDAVPIEQKCHDRVNFVMG